MKVERMALRHDTAPHPVFRQVAATIRQKKLLRPDDRVLARLGTRATRFLHACGWNTA